MREVATGTMQYVHAVDKKILNTVSIQQDSIKGYMLDFCIHYKWYVILVFVMGVLSAFMTISVEYKIKEILDLIVYEPQASVLPFVGLLVLFKLISHGSIFGIRLLDAYFKPKIGSYVFLTLSRRVFRHSLHWFDAQLSGDISNKVADVHNGLFDIFNAYAQVVVAASGLVMLLVFLCVINPVSALIAAVFMVLYIPVVTVLFMRQLNLQKPFAESRQQMLGVLNDLMANIYSVKVIGSARSEIQSALLPVVKAWEHWGGRTRYFDAFPISVVDALLVVLLNGVQITVLALMFQSGVVSAGEFAFVAMLTLGVHSKIERLLEEILFSINPAVACMRSAFDRLLEPVAVQDCAHAKPLIVSTAAIQFNSVFFAYHKDKPVFSNLVFRVSGGERVGIVGTSGAGKTTLVKCILRYFDVDDGCITIDGQDITQVTQDSLRSSISVIPQDISLFHRSIMDNLKVAHPSVSDAAVFSACRRARIHHDILALPNGYETVVGERGVKLSGGQRQRIAIARALLKEAPILILDEATSSLDTPTERLIQQSLDTLLSTRGSTVIAIAHRLSTLKQMDRIVVLENGCLIEEGRHEDLLQLDGGAYKRLWQLQEI